MYIRLTSFLEKENVLYQNQHGFLKNKFTITALDNFYNCLLKLIEVGKSTGTIFGDLSKAFDSVQHSLLLAKLEKYGIRGMAGRWFELYLEKKIQILERETSKHQRLNLYYWESRKDPYWDPSCLPSPVMY